MLKYFLNEANRYQDTEYNRVTTERIQKDVQIKVDCK